LKQVHRDKLLVEQEPASLLDAFVDYTPTQVGKLEPTQVGKLD
jgi:hypothetical protein